MPEYNVFLKVFFPGSALKQKYTLQVEKRRFANKLVFSALVKYAFEGFFGFSIVPLKIATFLGMITSLAALIYFIVILVQKILIGIEVEGYATIVSLILLLSGVQLICMGIIGEYLGRTYLETKKRPHFIVKSIYKTKAAQTLENEKEKVDQYKQYKEN